MLRFFLTMLTVVFLGVSGINAEEVTGNPSEIQSAKTVTSSGTIRSFGDYLFNGNFGKNKKESFNEKYRLNNHDVLGLIVWGAVSMEMDLKVDLKGNIFIPEIGIINVKGRTIKEVNEVLQSRIKGIYKKNVFHYITVKNYQKINVIVSGEVENPGIYEGYPTDLVIEYIGQAAGITENGSYRNIVIKRNNQKVEDIDLYEFIKSGSIKNFQFQDGDVVFVPKKKRYIFVKGECSFDGVFEMKGKFITMDDLLEYITPDKMVNEYEISYAYEGKEVQKMISLHSERKLYTRNTVDFKTNLIKEKINVYLTGEHGSKEHYVIKRNTNLKEFLKRVEMTNHSEFDYVNLYRESIKKEQKDMIDNQMNSMRRTLYNVSSTTLEEENIRTSEIKRIQQFIEEASQLEPKGQMVISDVSLYKDIYLKDGDTIEIPSKDSLVSVYGEVMFPNTFVVNQKTSVGKMVSMAGGYSDNADSDKIFIVKRNGTVHTDAGDRTLVFPGDKVVVLQEIDSKGFLLFKDLTQTMYQIALSTGVVLGI